MFDEPFSGALIGLVDSDFERATELCRTASNRWSRRPVFIEDDDLATTWIETDLVRFSLPDWLVSEEAAKPSIKLSSARGFSCVASLNGVSLVAALSAFTPLTAALKSHVRKIAVQDDQYGRVVTSLAFNLSKFVANMDRHWIKSVQYSLGNRGVISVNYNERGRSSDEFAETGRRILSVSTLLEGVAVTFYPDLSFKVTNSFANRSEFSFVRTIASAVKIIPARVFWASFTEGVQNSEFLAAAGITRIERGSNVFRQ